MGTKTTIFIIVIVAIAVFQGLGVIGVSITKNNVYGAWLETRNQYKRQADLIPRLVNLTYSYLNYEQQTFLKVAVVEAVAVLASFTHFLIK